MGEVLATKSEDVGLIVRAISFQDFQPVVMIYQRYRQTDRHTTCDSKPALCTIQGVPKKTYPLVYFDDNFGKYGPILTIFSLLQQDIYDTQKSSYFSHLTFIMMPLYLAKQTLMLVSMRIFLDHAAKQISMYSNGYNIYLLIYSNASRCHC